jgi:hypothetical protein
VLVLVSVVQIITSAIGVGNDEDRIGLVDLFFIFGLHTIILTYTEKRSAIDKSYFWDILLFAAGHTIVSFNRRYSATGQLVNNHQIFY